MDSKSGLLELKSGFMDKSEKFWSIKIQKQIAFISSLIKRQI